MAPPTHWNLTSLYAGPDDPHLEQDTKRLESKCRAFRKRWHEKVRATTSRSQLVAALTEYEKLYPTLDSPRPLLYLHLARELDTLDQELQARFNQVHQRYTHALNEVTFFELDLARLPQETIESLASHERFRASRRFLERAARSRPHLLSEAQEQIVNLKSLSSYTQWVAGVEKAIAKQRTTVRGTELTVTDLSNRVQGERRADRRRRYHAEQMRLLGNVADFAEAELNALALDKATFDHQRGYKHPYSATIENYDNDERAILTLVRTVEEYYPLAHRFYQLKRELLGLDTLTYADRAAPIGKSTRTYSFEESHHHLRETFDEIDPQYREILERMRAEGQIDVYPRTGKTSGAFCANGMTIPTFVLLNHADDFRSAQTYAHEMGHAIHSERSKEQPPLVQDYTIAAAETASTFFEGLVTDRLLRTLPERERIIALHDDLQGSIATIFRQIAFFSFERDMHERIRQLGGMDIDALRTLMNEHMHHYLGPAVTLTPEDGNFLIMVSHLRCPFYVYTYAYGELISRALIERYKEDPPFIGAVDQFLAAGGSKATDELFADMGLNTRTPKLFRAGMASIERQLDELESLVHNR